MTLSRLVACCYMTCSFSLFCVIQAELAGDNKEVYLFRWLTETLKYVKEVSPVGVPVLQPLLQLLTFLFDTFQSDLKAKQGDIEKALIKVVASPDPYPTPGRAFRNLIGKCFVEMYVRGETRTMFETVQAFMKIAGDFKAPTDKDGSKM